MTIALEFKHDMTEWAKALPGAILAIERWGEVSGHMMLDQFGIYYLVKTRDDVKAPDGGAKLRVLRPATLRLGAQKALQEAGTHWLGWQREISGILYVVSRPNLITESSFDDRELDFMIQLALFREVWFA